MSALLPDPDQSPLSVGALTRRIKILLETGLPEVWVQGEISNFRRQASGHCYFSLKDSEAQISAVLFRGNAARLPASLDLRDGVAVIARGDLSVYEARGQYQLVVRHLQDAGAGRLQAAFEALKRRLDAEGLFAAARKRPLPQRPRVVGFITSPTGAALRDFVSILQRRNWTGRLIVLPARVQGAEAASDLTRMLELAPQVPGLDLLVIGRGGGSLEDLWPFNEEPVVRALAACPIPTISAVGHEIDFTLCDFAADRRAETPSAAAELISSGYLAALDDTRQLAERLDRIGADALRSRRHALDMTVAHLARLSPRARLETQFLQLDDLAGRLDAAVRARALTLERGLQRLAHLVRDHDPAGRLQLARAGIEALARRHTRLGGTLLPARRERLDSLAKRLAAADPRLPLQRGYTLVRDAAGRLLPRRAEVTGGPLTIEFADGTLAVQPTDAGAPTPSAPAPRPRRRRQPAAPAGELDLFGENDQRPGA